jgi:hypothetical protein
LLSLSFSTLNIVVLDPDSKTKYFQKHWGKDLELEVRDSAKKIVCFVVSFFDLAFTDEFFGTLVRRAMDSAQ